MKLLLFMTGLCLSLSALAGNPEDSARLVEEQLKRIDSVESGLHYKSGKLQLGDKLATLNIPSNFKFLESAEAKFVVEDVWGNLKGNAPLGLIVPASTGASYADYAFIVEYEPIGYVKDGDADDIDYDDLMKEMKEGQSEANAQRASAGLPVMNLVGWAAKPHYDANRKVLYWAKEIAVSGSDENTLNYEIRVLGRKGILVLTAVSGMSQLDSVNANINDILGMVAFNEGNRYSDFDSGTDNVAAWTIGGLVAGKVLAKAGIFALLLKYIKLVIIGLAAIGGAIWRFITGRRKKAEDELVYEPAPIEPPQPGTRES